MPYHVQPASLQDAEEIRDCVDKAFANSTFSKLMFPSEKAHLTPLGVFRAYMIARQRKRMDDPNAHYFKAVDPDRSNAVVGYANWYLPGNLPKKVATTEQQPAAEPVLHNVADAPPIGGANADERPACINGEALDEFTQKMDEQREKIWSTNSSYYYLGALGVDSAYKGRGIARQLMQFGIESADKDGLPIYLEATPDGLPMYQARFGFQPVSDFEISDGQYKVVLMIRPPRA
ncbi:hypothetical protein LTR56_021408 [Elasticomyces elasticus]|nr:hypothetical protein LTR56_021408 [Elasticomyces elasticus]KAK3624687.1 hypothetical protein LTR22_023881 [Elasticomyces elasticus]KAK5754300.1 hypothetical protein LTS12_015591 [Elasticomyces elasticus]